MKIVLTFDTNYAPHAATAMESIIQNCPEKLDFAVIYYDLSVEIMDTLSKHFKTKVNSLVFHKAEVSKFKNIKSLPHIKNPINVMLRLLIPDLLPETDDYALYLDSDVVIRDNILKIFLGTDLSKPVCAVTEYDPAYKLRDLSALQEIEKPALHHPPLFYEAYFYRTFQDLGFTFDDKYFYAAVMIINLKYWRENNIGGQAVEFILKNPQRAFAADLDALNFVIKGNYYALHPRWCYLEQSIYSNYPADILKQAKENPAIIHGKNWNYSSDEYARKEYLKYRKLTPFLPFVYEDKTSYRIFVKKIKKPALKFLIKKSQKFYERYDNKFFASARVKK